MVKRLTNISPTIKDVAKKVSIGPKIYFASQTVAIVNNELDRRGI